MDNFGHIECDRPKKASFIKVRLIITILASLCPVVCYISRQNLPFAIVSMVDEAHERSTNSADAAAAAATQYPDKHQDNVIESRNSLPDSAFGNDMGLLDDADERGARTLSLNSRRSNASVPRSFRPRPRTLAALAYDTCPEPLITDESGKVTTLAKARTYGPKYDWSQKDKGWLLGAFFYTYVFFQIPGARVAEKMGAKWVLAAASLGSAVLSFVAPWSASVHVHLFSAMRFLMGVFQAALYPACYVLYSKWLPPAERSQALPILGVGAYVGSIIASALTGYFSEQEQFGWEYSFYVPGILCLVWSAAWIWFASNEPRDHRSISIEELQSIELRMEVNNQPPSRRTTSIENLEAAVGQGGDTNQAPASLPSSKKDISWLKLIRSRSIWAMMAAFFASNWSFSIVLLLIPTYLNNILRVSPMQNGIINSVIYVIYCVASPLVGACSTMMVETRACGLTRLSIRKLFQGVALFGQAVCFMAIAWIGCDRTLVFALLYVQIVFFSLVNGGEVQLPTEISVDFSGTIYAIGNCVGSSTGFIVPFVFSWIVTEPYSRSHWDFYFYVAAVITALGATIFLIFGNNKMQDFSIDLDDSQMDFVKFGGLATTKGGSFNLDSYQNRSQQSLTSINSNNNQQQQHNRRTISRAIRNLPALKQVHESK